jgi:uncharacterized protein (DUF488 family)
LEKVFARCKEGFVRKPIRTRQDMMVNVSHQKRSNKILITKWASKSSVQFKDVVWFKNEEIFNSF